MHFNEKFIYWVIALLIYIPKYQDRILGHFIWMDQVTLSIILTSFYDTNEKFTRNTV